MKTTIRLVLTVLTFFCLAAVGPKAQAVVPPPDGGYPNFTTAEGQNALLTLTTGAANTAVGWSSLLSNATGSFNTATGAGTLLFNTADENTAFGAAALLFNTIGAQNTAVGTTALLNNTEGTANTATGHSALHDNSTGAANTATGFEALFTNADGFQNTATGVGALFTNADGFQNTATGAFALNGNTEGDQNTAVGRSALSSNTSGSGNIALGFFAGANVITADNVICIGAEVGGADVSDSCFIGNIYSNVQPIVGTDPDSVTITSAGRLGRGNVSSRRYKHDIQPMEKASELLYALKPVSFRYNKKYDATQTLAFGLIAEEVAEVYPDLVGRNPSGEPESVRYEQINAMLLNEFLKEHRKNEQQESKIEEQEAKIARQQKQIEALTVGLQKVSAQIEASKPAPQMVLNTD
jgi:trimeric autotransporter adhesin